MKVEIDATLIQSVMGTAGLPDIEDVRQFVHKLILSSNENVTSLVATIDASTEPWNIWRAAGGKWIVQRGHGRTDPSSRTLEATTIPEVLQLAVDSKRLPVIPRKPQLCHYGFEKYSTGARPWKVLRNGQPVQHLNLKRDAVAAVKQQQIQQREDIDAWNKEHFYFTESHTADVDFYWIDT
jgi:hypothetical protein